MANKNNIERVDLEKVLGDSDVPCYPKLAKYETEIHSHPAGLQVAKNILYFKAINSLRNMRIRAERQSTINFMKSISNSYKPKIKNNYDKQS